MATKQVPVLFGVKGGGSVSGDSGRQILEDLKSITKQIEASGATKLSWSIDTKNIDSNVKKMSEYQQGLLQIKAATEQTKQEIAKNLGLLQQQNAQLKVSTAEIGKETAQHKNNITILNEETAQHKKNTAAINEKTAALKQQGVVNSQLATEQKRLEAEQRKAASKTISSSYFDSASVTKSSYESRIAALKANKVDVSDLETPMNRLNSAFNAYSASTTSKDAAVAYKTEASVIRTLITEKERLYSVSKKATKSAEMETNAKNMQISVNDKAYKRLREYVEFYKTKLASAGKLGEGNDLLNKLNTGTTTRSEAQARIEEYMKSCKLAGVETEKTTDKIKNLFTQHLGTAVAMLGVHMLSQAVQELYHNVVDLDTAVTNLQVASGNSRSATKSLLQDYSKMGMELGASTTEVADAANDWIRQGYSISDTNILIKDSMMLSKLGMIDSAEATTALTSALKGYQLNTSDAESVVSKLVAVDIQAATSSGDLAKAMSECSNSARIAGIDMDTLIGYLAKVQDVTQDSSEAVGNFAKTMFTRMGNIKSKYLVDPETGEDLSDVESVLSGVGIKLRDSSSNFRNFGDVLDEVGGKWKSYSNVQQRAIAVAFSGTRQQEKFLTLMENYDGAKSLAGVAANADGTAVAKYSDAYLNSIVAAQNKVKASFESLSQTILNSGLITGTFNTGTGFLGFLNSAIEKLGVIPSLLVGITAVSPLIGGGILKRQSLYGGGSATTSIFDKFLISDSDLLAIKNYNAELAKGTSWTEAYGTTLGDASKKARAMASSMQGAAVNIEGMGLKAVAAQAKVVALNFAMNAGIALAMAIVAALFKYFKENANTLENNTRKLNETKEAWSEVKDEQTKINTELDATKQKIAEINKHPISLTEAEELKKLERQNDELERQKIIKDELAKDKEEKVRKDAAKTLASRASEDNEFGYNAISRDSGTNNGLVGGLGRADNQQTLEEYILPNIDNKDTEVRAKAIEQLGKEIAARQEILKDLEYVDNPTTQAQKNINMQIEALKWLENKYLDAKDIVVSGNEEIADSVDDIKTATDTLAFSLENFKTVAADLSKLGKDFENFQKNGFISASELSEIQTAFSDVQGIDNYVKQLSSVNLTAEQSTKILSTLAYEHTKNKIGLNNLNEANRGYIENMLKEANVVNATEIATALITEQEAQFAVQTSVSNKGIQTKCENLGQWATEIGITTGQLTKLILKQVDFNNTKMSVDDKIAVLKQLDKQTGHSIANLVVLMNLMSRGKFDENGNFTYTLHSDAKSRDYDGIQRTLTPADIQGMVDDVYKDIESANMGTPPEVKYKPSETYGKSSSSSTASIPDKPTFTEATKEKYEYDTSYWDFYDSFLEDGKKKADEFDRESEKLNAQYDNALKNFDYEQAASINASIIERNKTKQALDHATADDLRGKLNGEVMPEIWKIAPELAGSAYGDISQIDRQRISKDLENKVYAAKNAVTAEKNRLEAEKTQVNNAWAQRAYDLKTANGNKETEQYKVEEAVNKEYNKKVDNLIKNVSQSGVQDAEYMKSKFESLFSTADNYDSRIKELGDDWFTCSDNIQKCEDNLKSMTDDAFAQYKRHVERTTKELQEQAEAYEFMAKQGQALTNANQKMYEVQSKIRTEQSEITKELRSNKALAEYLDEDTRKLLFNDKDYNTLSGRLSRLSNDVSGVNKWYRTQINKLTKDNWYLEESITKEYERRLSTKQEEYELAKKELDLEKKRLELNNVLNEKNIRMLVKLSNGGYEWQYIHDTQKAAELVGEIASAEETINNAKMDADANAKIQAEQAKIDALTQNKNAIDNNISLINKEVDKMALVIEDITNPLADFGNVIKKLTADLGGKINPNMDEVKNLSTINLSGNASDFASGKKFSLGDITKKAVITPTIAQAFSAATKFGSNYSFNGDIVLNNVQKPTEFMIALKNALNQNSFKK